MAESNPSTPSLETALERYVYFFNHLERELEHIAQYQSADVEFWDPFNHVFGIQASSDLLRKFIDNVEHPHFEVTGQFWNQSCCLLRWQFSGILRVVGDWRFPGVSELEFNGEGKVIRHIDYWDSGEHFYARLPILWGLIRTIRRRV